MPELNFAWAVRETIKNCGLRANWIATQSGVPKQTISSFINEKQALNTTNLEKILSVLPFEARQHCFSLLLGQSSRPTLTAIIRGMNIENPSDRKEAADALRLIVSKFIPDDNNSENQSKIRENTEELAQVR